MELIQYLTENLDDVSCPRTEWLFGVINYVYNGNQKPLNGNCNRLLTKDDYNILRRHIIVLLTIVSFIGATLDPMESKKGWKEEESRGISRLIMIVIHV